jgi:hypothetical protein
VEWGVQELPLKSDLEDEDEGERSKENSEVAKRRPIDVEMMMEKQRLTLKFGEHIFLFYIDRRRRTRRLMNGMNGDSGGSVEVERAVGMEFAVSAARALHVQCLCTRRRGRSPSSAARSVSSYSACSWDSWYLSV